MPEYIIRDGVELLEIHGTYILCADEKAREKCPYTKQLNDTGAMIWNLLKDGYTSEQILSELSNEFEIDDLDILKNDLISFIDSLVESRYLTIIS